MQWRNLTYMPNLGLERTDCCVQLTWHIQLIGFDYGRLFFKVSWYLLIEDIVYWRNVGGYPRFPKTQHFSIDWSTGDAFCPMEKDKRWTNELFLLIWTFSQDFHLENWHIMLEASGIARLSYDSSTCSRTEEHWITPPHPHFQWRLCVLSSCGVYTLDDH